MSSAFVIEEFSAVTKNTLRGFAKIRMPSGMIVADVSIHVRDGRAWASPPSKPRLDRDGQQMRDADGRALWVPIITFANREQRDRWSDAAIAAVRQSYPYTFDGLAVTP
jgi:hypothetical protein